MWTRRQFLNTTGASAAAATLGMNPLTAEQPQIIGGLSAPTALTSSLSAASATLLQQDSTQLEAAQGVLQRQLGSHYVEFRLSMLQDDTAPAYPTYEIEASGGKVDVRGTSAVAICRGVYTYLREQCGAMITWSGKHLELPSPLPSLARQRVVCPYQHVQYLNPCTFGYTMAFWDWTRWEQELDWMALHGITMPLAMDGQEWVWQQVWASIGLSQAEIDAFSVGPAHLPWHRMGNINHFDGPLSQHWVEVHRQLQHRILNRMRALGMTPVVPAFAGFVPRGLLRVRPEAQTFTQLWLPKEFLTIPRSTQTYILHPSQEDLYKEIGKLFIQAYKAEYGEVKYYLADTFNELTVPVSANQRYEDLERFGKTVYAGIQAGDPDGTWVMQAWLFVFDPFWDAKSVEALLQGIPDDRMLLLDYSNDLAPGLRDKYAPSPWKRNSAFYGKQWCNGMAHTFGGNNNVKGNLSLIASEPAATLKSPSKGNLVGWSICPEGIETNEVVYELMTDAGWQIEPIELDTWIPAYCASRYGSCPPAMLKAWSMLLKSAYSSHVWMTKQAWQGEPTLTPQAQSVDAGPLFVEATLLFLSCAPALAHAELYRNDLIEFTAQAVGGWVDQQLVLATESLRSKEYPTAKVHASAAIGMLAHIDAILNLRSDRRLETWVSAGRTQAATPDEAASNDENARRLITTWGWPELTDYASRVWSGLTRDYYAARWHQWFEHQWTETDFSLDIWQQTWLSRPYKPTPPTVIIDLAATATKMLQTCKYGSTADFG
jgi:alpha-N-acetylglucosaminidase